MAKNSRRNRNQPSRQPARGRSNQNQQSRQDNDYDHNANANQEKFERSRLSNFEARSENQRKLFNSSVRSPIVVAVGPAGTGKSFTEAYAASKLLLEKKIDQIILTRNPLPAGESLGFFKGTDKEKMFVWLAPIMGQFRKILGSSFVDYLIAIKKIDVVPMETVKGSSFDRTFLIVDEAQECSMEQLKNLVTRIGEDSTILLNGDYKQTNSKIKGKSPLLSLVEMFERENDRVVNTGSREDLYIPVIEFTSDEIVRSPLVRQLVKMFEREDG